MHCHIAWHVSSGLAMQILENVDRMKLQDPQGLQAMCQSWDKWYQEDRLTNPVCKGYDPTGTHFQDDSGV